MNNLLFIFENFLNENNIRNMSGTKIENEIIEKLKFLLDIEDYKRKKNKVRYYEIAREIEKEKSINNVVLNKILNYCKDLFNKEINIMKTEIEKLLLEIKEGGYENRFGEETINTYINKLDENLKDLIIEKTLKSDFEFDNVKLEIKGYKDSIEEDIMYSESFSINKNNLLNLLTYQDLYKKFILKLFRIYCFDKYLKNFTDENNNFITVKNGKPRTKNNNIQSKGLYLLLFKEEDKIYFVKDYCLKIKISESRYDLKINKKGDFFYLINTPRLTSYIDFTSIDKNNNICYNYDDFLNLEDKETFKKELFAFLKLERKKV